MKSPAFDLGLPAKYCPVRKFIEIPVGAILCSRLFLLGRSLPTRALCKVSSPCVLLICIIARSLKRPPVIRLMSRRTEFLGIVADVSHLMCFFTSHQGGLPDGVPLSPR